MFTVSNRSLIRHFQEVNDGRPEALVYSLGDRGFFAEITTVARAMIYAWSRRQRLLLDSHEFAYRYQQGWNDYFEPFCSEPTGHDGASIAEWVRFVLKGDQEPFERLRGFQPEHLEFGPLEVHGFQKIMSFFMRMIFRLSDECGQEVERVRQSLDLPNDYAALHIRRGDKVGDEDVYYATSDYFDALGPIGDQPLFVMTDDYGAVREVQELLLSRGMSNPVVTLCRQEHTGFDVWALRAGKSFAGDKQRIDNEEARRRYRFEETTRLLAETVIAKGSSRFVSTWNSNVGRSVWYLHDHPERCRQLR